MKILSPLASAKAIYSRKPDHVPIQERIILKKWFTEKTLASALALIHNSEVRSFFFFRHGTGILLRNGDVATIYCSPGKGGQAFVFRDGWCGQCLAGRRGYRCAHVAAASLLSLYEHDEQVMPLHPSFVDGDWYKLGLYLCNHARGGFQPLDRKKHKDVVCIEARGADGMLLRVHASAEAVEELHELSQNMDNKADGISSLLKTIVVNTCTETELELLDRGRKSRKLNQDTSIWMWLVRLCFLHHSHPDLDLSRDRKGRYQLVIGGSRSFFTLVPGRCHTWELIDSLGPERFGFTMLPRAEQYSRVYFGKGDDTINVEQWCHLPDGSSQSLDELEASRYGPRYIIGSKVFALGRPGPGETVVMPGEASEKMPTLFSFARQDTKKKHSFQVSQDQIPDFLETNHQALRSRRNEVAPEILEHVVATEPDLLELTEGYTEREWWYIAGYYRVGNRRIRLADILAAAGKGKRFLPGRTWLDLKSSPFVWFHSLGRDRIMADGHIRLTREELLLLGCQAPEIQVEASVEARSTLLAFLLERDEAGDVNYLQDLAGEIYGDRLRSYQAHGVNWMANLFRHGLGGILADDMGLGKTHQALALAGLVGKSLAAEKNCTILIVCPAAVLYHWQEKQERFFPELDLSIHHGPKRDFKAAIRSGIVVTTYGVMRRDMELLAGHGFTLVILDEAHYLKNMETMAARAARALRAESVFCLTGTPLENSIDDLQGILGFCLPGLFSSRPMQTIFGQRETEAQRARIQRIIHPFILRRTRAQVLGDLPPLSEDIRLCSLHPDQVTAYKEAVRMAGRLLEELPDTSGQHQDYAGILATIMRLKQICNHLCLIEKCTKWDRYGSGKWTEFVRLVEQVLSAGHKLVVFSQFTGMLDIIEAWLESRDTGHVSLRGDVGLKERERRIERFNNEDRCRICCASLLAGGTGIDLTGAQVVIHYDRWWNPAKEEQATARVHRMGQQLPVQVYKLVTRGTLEEKIHFLIENKKKLARELIRENEGSVLKNLDRNELRALFQLQQ